MELFETESFDIVLNGTTARVTEHTFSNQQVFRIDFADATAPLMITRASTANGKMWMSIPQGRLKEAEQAGQQISDYFKNKK